MSVFDAFPVKGSKAELRAHVIRLTGTGASAPTVTTGEGITATRSGTGAYTLTWGDSPGTFVCATSGLAAATPGDLAGHTVILDEFSSLALPLVLYNASDAAHDLAASEYIDIVVWFKYTSV